MVTLFFATVSLDFREKLWGIFPLPSRHLGLILMSLPCMGNCLILSLAFSKTSDKVSNLGCFSPGFKYRGMKSMKLSTIGVEDFIHRCLYQSLQEEKDRKSYKMHIIGNTIDYKK